MEFHPVAELFPLIEGEEFRELCEDIRKRGLLEPITLYEGKVADGRNRYRACEATGTPPRYETYTGDDLEGFVCSKNLHRRQLTHAQKVQVGLNLLEWERTKARERQAEGRKLGGGDRKSEEAKTASSQVCEEAVSRRGEPAVKKAAARVGVSEGSLQSAARLQAEAPELLGEAVKGKRTIGGAVNELRRRQGKEPLGVRTKAEGADRAPRRGGRKSEWPTAFVNPGETEGREPTLYLFNALDIAFTAGQLRGYYRSLDERRELIRHLLCDLNGQQAEFIQTVLAVA